MSKTAPRTQAPRQRRAPVRARPWLYGLAGAALVAVAVTVLLVGRGSGETQGGLPATSDYHSLLVGTTSPDDLILGTHQGLFRSTDGGRTWRADTLPGSDAMNLVRPGRRSLWVAGHEVLARSADGGVTWADVRPEGLPGLDVHAFAVDPATSGRLFAAVAGRGLYRSEDDGRSFALVSRAVGPAVMALAVLPGGRLLAGDLQQRALLESGDGGRSWRVLVRAPVAGLAVNPENPKLVLASGSGVLRSDDGGETWEQPLALEAGSGPVAWSPSSARIAYVVGFDRSLYRSADAGLTWQPVVEGQAG